MFRLKLPLLGKHAGGIKKNIIRAYSQKTMACVEVRIEAPAGQLAGKWWGPRDNQPLLVWHGWQETCGSFDEIIPHLPPHVGYLALDFHGHGLSSWLPAGHRYHFIDGPIVLRYLQQKFNWERLALMGHSMGAAHSYFFSGFYPQAVDYVICLDNLSPMVTPGCVEKYAEVADGLLKMFERSKAGASANKCYPLEELTELCYQGMHKSVAREKLPVLMRRAVQEATPGMFCFRRDPRLKAFHMMNWNTEDVLAHAARIVCPLLNTEGTPWWLAHISPLNEQVKDVIRRGNPSAEFHVMPGTHHGFLNTPEVYGKVVSAFINKHHVQRALDDDIFEKILIV